MAHRGIQLLVVLLAAFASVGYARAPQKVRHGEDALIIDFPYQVFIFIYENETNSGFCGGSIIDAKHILTAAHCVQNETSVYSADSFDVYTASENYDNTDTDDIFKVVEVILHPGSNSTTEPDPDIAILRLSESMTFNNKRKSLQLPTEDLSEGADVMATGWGYGSLDHTIDPGPILQKLEFTIANSTLCQPQPIDKMFISMICAKPKQGGAVCSGDSGGPLSSNGTVFGVAIKSQCISNLPAVFTRVSTYVPWIKSIIGG